MSNIDKRKSGQTKKEALPFTCPICGRKTEHPFSVLREGAELICPFCKLKLILHGHMWQEVQQEMKKLTDQER